MILYAVLRRVLKIYSYHAYPNRLIIVKIKLRSPSQSSKCIEILQNHSTLGRNEIWTIVVRCDPCIVLCNV